MASLGMSVVFAHLSVCWSSCISWRLPSSRLISRTFEQFQWNLTQLISLKLSCAYHQTIILIVELFTLYLLYLCMGKVICERPRPGTLPVSNKTSRSKLSNCWANCLTFFLQKYGHFNGVLCCLLIVLSLRQPLFYLYIHIPVIRSNMLSAYPFMSMFGTSCIIAYITQTIYEICSSVLPCTCM